MRDYTLAAAVRTANNANQNNNATVSRYVQFSSFFVIPASSGFCGSGSGERDKAGWFAL